MSGVFHVRLYAPTIQNPSKMFCQLLQPTPDAVPDTTGVHAFLPGNLICGHSQIVPGINPLGLLLRQSHHSRAQLLLITHQQGSVGL